ncbi:hypothetical protein VTI28DRAFT_9469 [Corynascus sepedonium]
MICAQCQYALQCIVNLVPNLGERQVHGEKYRKREEPREPEHSHWLTHHPTLESFRESVDQRCSVCIVLWKALEPEQQSFLMKPPQPSNGSTSVTSLATTTTFYISDRQIRRGDIFINVFFNCPEYAFECPALHSSGPPGPILVLELEPINDSSIPPDVLTDNTRSPGTLALAKRWVSDCVRHHKRCRAGSGGGVWYPRRLLDLSRSNEASEQQSEQIVRLIETADVIPAGRYTTVSHRWGSMEQLRLTKHTYPQLAEGLPLRSLPQLVQDVIFVSLEFGIRYVWIDLLCIYQDEDNMADWQREATLMNRVYSNSFCNISAGDAKGCHESLFASRDPNIFLPQLVELNVEHGDEKTQLFRVYDNSYWHRSVSRALVNTRAWVLQERFLSPRVLQFDKCQVLWECLEKSATETCPREIPRSLVGMGNLVFKNLVPIVQPTPTGAPNSKFLSKVRHIWTCLVEAYSACDLTVPSDKLIAISGIAQHIAALLQGDYVAGMWRSHLEGELLWYVAQSGVPGKTSRPAQYRAPSWSWASIDGPVRPGWSFTNHSLIKIDEVHLDYLTGDVFGAVTGGWLRLHGPLRQLQLVRNYNRGHGWEWAIIIEGVRGIAPEVSHGTRNHYPTSSELRLDIFQDSFEEDNKTGTLFAMLAGDVTVTLDPGRRDRRLEMLLLKLIDREKGIFERIGYAKVGNADADEIMRIQSSERASELPCIEYREGMHTICII